MCLCSMVVAGDSNSRVLYLLTKQLVHCVKFIPSLSSSLFLTSHRKTMMKIGTKAKIPLSSIGSCNSTAREYILQATSVLFFPGF